MSLLLLTCYCSAPRRRGHQIIIWQCRRFASPRHRATSFRRPTSHGVLFLLTGRLPRAYGTRTGSITGRLRLLLLRDVSSLSRCHRRWGVFALMFMYFGSRNRFALLNYCALCHPSEIPVLHRPSVSFTTTWVRRNWCISSIPRWVGLTLDNISTLGTYYSCCITLKLYVSLRNFSSG